MPLIPSPPHMPEQPGLAQQGLAPAQPGLPRPLAAEDLSRARVLADRLRTRFAQTLVGQETLRESLIVTLAAGGHILIESVPGLAKTTAAQTLATSVSGTFKRVQCTPDLMPSDLVGTQVFDFSKQRFSTQIGPIHANFVLLDEINRSNAKTQSAMLEAMAEGATTIGGERIALPKPFMVIATQNPIEEEGTFTLPEAQMDRFMMKAVMTYPTADEEERMLDMLTRRGSDTIDTSTLNRDALSIQDVEFLRSCARRVHVSDSIMRYAVDLAATSRGTGTNPLRDLAALVRLGASPRASIALVRIGQANALLAGRDYVIPEDVKSFAHEVLRHRIVLTFEAMADGVSADQVVDSVLEAVPVP
ncbi:MAG: MoxR family ATPase [Bifidobacterium tibiigranuli]|jgi:MoxR-like ATPase|uniref:AAA family ATPase n=1 Tax=Bifidobacterium tibiigranuli TaxID=2172043 RepID=UPI0023554774|nr:MoxR family ATPase [Bifidobacterium tibiigranuli]MCH3974271.1 MoxR family ATPase [Bifidobacterium tibiigranuli]MCH4188834.1 MoxR family ATPase [Bifidobacterium tibiigranuli]MCH4203261.1 MoxR family ATPase [Bifidobacterium tibiigranuli]MCH4273494.1 MoxR family ATPase [Bifidobacterium tibiigranuli]MCI1790608.1 MoxR family ATPase [Bifidobacterium tibiigranuli]